MKYFLLLATSFILFASCSSPVSEQTANIYNANSNVLIASNTNSEMIPHEGIDANQFNNNTSDISVVNRTPSSNDPQMGPRTAPDNSLVNTTQRSDGSFAETRTFKDHPELSKVERVTNGAKVTVKVYLKNGKVIEVPKEKLQEFQILAPGNILLAAGIKPAVPQPKNPKKKLEGENESDLDSN